VSAVAGTTRDVVSQTIQIHGVPLHVADTAGLRESSDEVEQIGVARAWGQIESADAVLFLHDLTRADQPDYAAADAEILRGLQGKLPASVPVLDVWNKQDAAPAAAPARGIALSAKTGLGIEACATSCWRWPAGSPCPRARISRERAMCRRWARSRRTCALAASHLAAQAQLLDLLAEELRLAQNALNEITGEFGADDLLGVIFSRFCIGK
jgi:tRNA modification GTPase